MWNKYKDDEISRTLTKISPVIAHPTGPEIAQKTIYL